MEQKEFTDMKKRAEDMVADERDKGTNEYAILRMVLNRATAMEGMSYERTYTESQIAELVRLVIKAK